MSLILGILDSGGAAAGAGGSYESIATVTVGGGGSATITFSSIPATYTHLQIRGIYRTNRASFPDFLKVRYNSDSGNNYSEHRLQGDGSSASSAGTANLDYAQWAAIASAAASANVFSGGVFDLLDYTNTNKYKTNRTLTGFDNNGSGRIHLESGSWRNTAAVNTITIISGSGSTFQQYTQFALYGVKS